MTDTSTPEGEAQRLALLEHELRTPLNAIIGYAEAMALQTFGPLPAPYGEHAATIQRAAVHLLNLVEDLTDRAQAEAGVWAGVRTTFDPVALTREVAALLDPRAKRGRIAMTTTATTEAGAVRGDRRAVRQILLNLIDNALKFTADGGEIVVALACEPEALRLEVRDSGGAAGEKGQGLGLRLVRALAGAHGGDVEMRSLETGGTVVAVRLPIMTET